MHAFNFLFNSTEERERRKKTAEKYSLWKQTKCDTLLSVRFCVHSFTVRTSVFTLMNTLREYLFQLSLKKKPKKKTTERKCDKQKKKSIKLWKQQKLEALGNAATSLWISLAAPFLELIHIFRVATRLICILIGGACAAVVFPLFRFRFSLPSGEWKNNRHSNYQL